MLAPVGGSSTQPTSSTSSTSTTSPTTSTSSGTAAQSTKSAKAPTGDAYLATRQTGEEIPQQKCSMTRPTGEEIPQQRCSIGGISAFSLSLADFSAF